MNQDTSTTGQSLSLYVSPNTRTERHVGICLQFRQKLANFAVFCARHFFDGITSYNLESMNERKWLRRILFLETVAGREHSNLKTAPLVHVLYGPLYSLVRLSL